MVDGERLRSKSCLQAATNFNMNRFQRGHSILCRNAFIASDIASLFFGDFAHFVRLRDRLIRHLKTLGYLIKFLVLRILRPFKFGEALRAEKIFHPISLLLLFKSIRPRKILLDLY